MATRRKTLRTLEGAKKAVREVLAAQHTIVLAPFVALYGPKSQELVADAVTSLVALGEVEFCGVCGECIRFRQAERAGSSKGRGKGSKAGSEGQGQAKAANGPAGNRFRGLSASEAAALYRRECFRLHPDRNAGETHDVFVQMQREWEAR